MISASLGSIGDGGVGIPGITREKVKKSRSLDMLTSRSFNFCHSKLLKPKMICCQCDGPAEILLGCLHSYCALCLKDFREDHTSCCGMEISIVEKSSSPISLPNLQQIEEEIDRECQRLKDIDLAKKIMSIRETFESEILKIRQKFNTALTELEEIVPTQQKEIEIRQDDLQMVKDQIKRVKQLGICPPENLSTIRRIVDSELVVADASFDPSNLSVEKTNLCHFPDKLSDVEVEEWRYYHDLDVIDEFGDYRISYNAHMLEIFHIHKPSEILVRKTNFVSLNILDDHILFLFYQENPLELWELWEFRDGKLSNLQKTIPCNWNVIIPYPSGCLCQNEDGECLFVRYGEESNTVWRKNFEGYIKRHSEKIFCFSDKFYSVETGEKISDNLKPHWKFELDSNVLQIWNQNKIVRSYSLLIGGYTLNNKNNLVSLSYSHIKLYHFNK